MAKRNMSANAEFVAALGKYPDAEVAKKFEVSMATVFQARTSRNIPSHSEARRAEVVPLLATHTDEELMERYGYSKAGIATLRRANNAPYAGETPPRKRRSRKAATETATEAAAIQANPLVELPPKAAPARVVKSANELTGDPAMMEFLTRRHKAGDATEALAARIEVPEALVRQALGLN